MRLLILILSPLAAAAALAGPPEDFWRAKGEYFRLLLKDDGDHEQATARAALTRHNEARAEAAVAEAKRGHAPEPEKRPPYVPAHGFRLDELDMIQRSKDLRDADKAELVRIFRRAAADLKKLRAERDDALKALARDPRHPPALADVARELFKKEMDVSLRTVEATARILVRAGIDQDYAYRAYLREHRRLGIR